jgi:hypothetical protein
MPKWIPTYSENMEDFMIQLNRNLSYIFGNLDTTNVTNIPALNALNKTISISDWDATVTYGIGDACYDSGAFYKATTGTNLNKQPTLFPDDWDVITMGGGVGTVVILQELNDLLTLVASGALISDDTAIDGETISGIDASSGVGFGGTITATLG